MSNLTFWGWVLFISNLFSGPTQSASGSGESSISLPVLMTFGLIEIVIFLWGRQHLEPFKEKPFLTEVEARSIGKFFGRK